MLRHLDEPAIAFADPPDMTPPMLTELVRTGQRGRPRIHILRHCWLVVQVVVTVDNPINVFLHAHVTGCDGGAARFFSPVWRSCYEFHRSSQDHNDITTSGQIPVLIGSPLFKLRLLKIEPLVSDAESSDGSPIFPSLTTSALALPRPT